MIQERHDAWNEHYDPQTPAEQHLVNEAADATVRFDRCTRYHHACVGKQVRDAQADWDFLQIETLEHHKTLLDTQPALAVRQLKRTLSGCEWLLARWQELKATFREDWHWPTIDRDLALRLWGYSPSFDSIKSVENVYIMCLYNAFAPGLENNPEEAVLLMDPAVMPESVREALGDDFPHPEFARAQGPQGHRPRAGRVGRAGRCVAAPRGGRSGGGGRPGAAAR